MNADHASDDAPVVGRLQTREGVSDLTVGSFGEGPNRVSPSAYARVIADVAPPMRRESDAPGDGEREDASPLPKELQRDARPLKW